MKCTCTCSEGHIGVFSQRLEARGERNALLRRVSGSARDGDINRAILAPNLGLGASKHKDCNAHYTERSASSIGVSPSSRLKRFPIVLSRSRQATRAEARLSREVIPS